MSVKKVIEVTGNPAPEVEVSLVVPLFNSEVLLEQLMERVQIVMDHLNVCWELVLVDDGSVDGTWDLAQRLKATGKGSVLAIQLTRNFGQHNATMCGLKHARGQFLVTLDDDMQTPPEEIPKLIKYLKEADLDLVYGVYQKKNHKPWRNLGSILVRRFYQFTFKSRIEVTSFRVLSRDLVEAIQVYGLNYTYLDGLFAWNTKRIGGCEVEHHPRLVGKSGYSFAKLLTLAANLFTNFSILPLQFVSLLGVLSFATGFSLAAFYAVQALTGATTIEGFATLVVAILVIGGVQLLGIGILGEYVGRLHMNVNQKPQYRIRSQQRRFTSALACSPKADR